MTHESFHFTAAAASAKASNTFFVARSADYLATKSSTASKNFHSSCTSAIVEELASTEPSFVRSSNGHSKAVELLPSS